MNNPTPDTCGHWLDEYDADRFWSNVNFRGGQDHRDDKLANASGDCWIWTTRRDPAGYGFMRVYGRQLLAHRIALKDSGVDFSDEQVVDHLCRNTRCVRPDHLEAVTHTENVQRGIAGNKTHCPSGHEYTVENTVYVKPRMAKYCRTCLKASKRRTYLKRKAAAEAA